MSDTKTFSYGDIDKFCMSYCQFQDVCTPYDCPVIEFVNWLMKGKP